MAQPFSPTRFSFGVIADVQYANRDNGMDFHQTEIRRYRNSLEIMKNAVKTWNEHHGKTSERPLSFVAQLGDLIDGSAKPHREAALDDIKSCIAESHCDKWAHCIGNHELYLYSREEAIEKILGHQPATRSEKSYYSFRPADGWKVVVLDPYMVSIITAETQSPTYAAALSLLREHNPNDVLGPCDWLKGMNGAARKYVPYNGAFGKEQLDWLTEELKAARDANEKVIVLSHVAIEPRASKSETIAWDNMDAIKVLHDFPGTVVAVLCGHMHGNGYHTDDKNIHHISFPAPLLSQPGQDCFAIVHVTEDGLQVQGYGDVESRALPC